MSINVSDDIIIIDITSSRARGKTRWVCWA